MEVLSGATRTPCFLLAENLESAIAQFETLLHSRYESATYLLEKHAVVAWLPSGFRG